MEPRVQGSRHKPQTVSSEKQRDALKGQVQDLAHHWGVDPSVLSVIVAWHDGLSADERAQFHAITLELQDLNNTYGPPGIPI